MATNNEYEYENEESIDCNLKCAICNEPFIDPVTTPCHHSFCRSCLERWLVNSRSTCPTCRKTILKKTLTSVTLLPFLSMLDQILVKCKICDQSNIQRGNFHDHINKTCPKTIVNCPASDNQCSWTGLREELQTHLSTCTFEPSRSQMEQNKVEKIETMRYNNQPIFCQQYSNDDLIIMYVNPDLQNIPVYAIAPAASDVIINQQCTHLNLFDHKLLPEYVLIIASALRDNTVLKSLELSKCSIYDLGVQHLTENLSTQNSLERLDLYGNFITDDGVKYLAKMLELNQSLSHLKLAYNNIGKEGMTMLANVLVTHNSGLKRLSLEGNKLIDDGCIYSIFSIIRYNQTLKILNLENCNLSWSSQKLIQICQRIYFRTDLEIFL